ncbi:UbiA family prenyltransferase [Chelativorans alearense]|uniref:UbiA family prenyltransferase n=1 Tax=Chelativorans alearense TaxID=2681495 RepID=UPI0013D444B9|nr:UbiA family prenyltransferase [Chelativorans alearense]
MTDLDILPSAGPTEPPPKAPPVPLVVDLDGTLIRTNLLLESVIALVKQSLLTVFLLPLWLMRGKATLKEEVTRRVSLDLSVLPLNAPLLEHLRRKKARGHRLILATGTHETLARKIADQLGLFDEVLATNGRHNLTGINKLTVLRHQFGATGFDYAGNAAADCPIWCAARQATVVDAPSRLVGWAKRNANVTHVFPRQRPPLWLYVRALRLHQWLKNILLFAPLVAALKFTDVAALTDLLIGFFAFGLCASSVYLVNDIIDLEDDRLHPNKRHRPFASGTLPVAHGLVLVPLLLAASAALCLFLPWQFAAVLGVYYAATLAYTFGLKRLEAIDIVTLALLYTTRIFAGAAAAQLPLSVWLLTFSIFLFLSLAIAKRYAELILMHKNGKQGSTGRGYRFADLPILRSMGVGAGYVAAVVLAVYLDTPQVAAAYAHPQILWVFVPVLVLWLTRVWIKTGRAEMHDDPLVFAARDRVSLAFAVLCGAVIGMAL